MLGALLLLLIVFFVSCTGGDGDDKRGKGTGASQAPTPAPADSGEPEEEPSFSDNAPNGGPSLPAPEDLDPQDPNPNPNPAANPSSPGSTGNNANVTAPAGGACADQEVSVTPLPAAATVKRGATLVIGIKIKNISTRPCTRDLGAGAQELYLDQGARKYWSSDTCSTDRSLNVIRMTPNTDYNFKITWNGRQTSKCAAALPAGPAPPPGQFELRARLGTKISDPVTLTVVA